VSGGSIELFPFQVRASQQIATRFVELLGDDDRPAERRNWLVPFYQALSALTGAGKTPILADAVAQMRAHVPVEPIVLWISKAKAVVDQTFANFDVGGKYNHLLEGYLVGYLSDLTPERIAAGTAPQIVLATVGTFNQSDKGDGTLRVHKPAQDKGREPLWEMLTSRLTTDQHRRPLFIVYDEGHNLSDQQTELLLELRPDAMLLASATLEIPARLSRLIQRLADHKGDDFLVTSVPSSDVVNAGLVKRQINLGGYSTNMETTLDDMLESMATAAKKANRLRLGFAPKAIYVCRTNVSQEDGTTDSASRPFVERKAPPILIWRYLTEQKGIDPADIAVYCDLRFDRTNHPPPKDFVLFSGGEDDFAVFSAGSFKHIIFNLSLQEGWDDPACYFAYIDKSMGSRVQVEQVIGRVLRQPGAKHYPDLDLNTAHFYIRVNDRQEFPKILETVRKRIAADVPEIVLESYTWSKTQQKRQRDPKQALTVPEIHIDSTEALPELQNVIARIEDYRADAVNTLGNAQVLRAIQRLGDGSTAQVIESERPHSNRVVARWLLRRTVQSLYPDVVKTIDWADERFDACVELTSPAADRLREHAERMVDLYLSHSELTYEAENPYTVGPVPVNPIKMRKFKHALHEGYSDLNSFELSVAHAIDRLRAPWARNPSNGGFNLPLLQKSDTRRFFPDFLIWTKQRIYAIDPKADHLIATAATRKLLDIRDERGRQKLIVRLMTEGKWAAEPAKRLSPGGYTLWSLRAGIVRTKHFPSIDKAVEGMLDNRRPSVASRPSSPANVRYTIQPFSAKRVAARRATRVPRKP